MYSLPVRSSAGVSALKGFWERTTRAGWRLGSLLYGSATCCDMSWPPTCRQTSYVGACPRRLSFRGGRKLPRQLDASSAGEPTCICHHITHTLEPDTMGAHSPSCRCGSLPAAILSPPDCAVGTWPRKGLLHPLQPAWAGRRLQGASPKNLLHRTRHLCRWPRRLALCCYEQPRPPHEFPGEEPSASTMVHDCVERTQDIS